LKAIPSTVARAFIVMYRLSQLSRSCSSPSSPRSTTPRDAMPPAASLPATGSVSPNAGSSSPAARRGSQYAFCASVP
jgi:hypothetical protein